MLARAAATAAACSTRFGGQAQAATYASSAGAGLADSILAYVRGGQATSADSAVDVLQTGLASTSAPLDTARLRLAWAEVEAGRGEWRASADLAKAAAVEAAGTGHSGGSLHAAAVDAHVRACLTAGWDSEAGDAGAAGDGWRALARHAACDAQGAAAAAATVASAAAPPSDDDADGGLSTAWAALRAGGVLFATGASDDAGRLFEAAAALASAPAPLTAPSGPATRRAALASALAGSAQILLARQDWAGAEDAAAAALKAATGEDGQTTSALPPPAPAAATASLLLLGDTFARRAQLTVAEGLYRRAALDAGLVDASGGGGSEGGKVWAAAHHHHPVHPSLAAAAAWRLAQLLTLVPRRSTEAGRWASAAAGAVGAGGGGGGGAEEAAGLVRSLGPLDGLKGGVVAGARAPWVDAACRRVLPRLDG